MQSRLPQQIAVGHPVRGNYIKPGNTHTGVTDWGNCQRCRLHHTRKRVAIRREGGSGHIRILFIGEAPGQLEDKTGTPFVGTAGRIFRWYIKFVPFNFHYLVTNAVGCRPVDVLFLDTKIDQKVNEEGFDLDDYVLDEDYELYDWNRNPTKGELERCSPHIQELLSTYKPHGVVYLGSIAASYQNPNYEVSSSDLHEHDARYFKHKESKDKILRYVPTLELYHPAYIARMEYKVLPVKKEAKKLEHFIERFLDD